jgi:acetyl-CoA carboxylase biotin carboxyl carrier protein
MSEPPPSPQIEALIEEFQRSGLRELHVRAVGIELHLSKDAGSPGLVVTKGAGPTPGTKAPGAGEQAAAAPVENQSAVPDGATVVTAPYLGTFYRAPKPGAPNYVEVGSMVEAQTEICLVEVMKLFTAVRAGTAGRIAAVLAGDGELVAAGQPLFAIEVE